MEDIYMYNICTAVIGQNVRMAPVKIRENLAIPEAQWAQAIGELCALNHIEEADVFRTCSHMEIYVMALSQNLGVKEVMEWMSKLSGVPVFELSKHRILMFDKDATQHQFEVASGLDSLVLGEGQILAQAKLVVKVGQGRPGFDRKISRWNKVIKIGASLFYLCSLDRAELSTLVKLAAHSL